MANYDAIYRVYSNDYNSLFNQTNQLTLPTTVKWVLIDAMTFNNGNSLCYIINIEVEHGLSSIQFALSRHLTRDDLQVDIHYLVIPKQLYNPVDTKTARSAISAWIKFGWNQQKNLWDAIYHCGWFLAGICSEYQVKSKVRIQRKLPENFLIIHNTNAGCAPGIIQANGLLKNKSKRPLKGVWARVPSFLLSQGAKAISMTQFTGNITITLLVEGLRYHSIGATEIIIREDILLQRLIRVLDISQNLDA